jgi:excisionase family DNA binding protein
MEFYTVAEVAEILKLSTKTVYALIKSEKLSVVQIGGVFRITEQELNRLKKEGA